MGCANCSNRGVRGWLPRAAETALQPLWPSTTIRETPRLATAYSMEGSHPVVKCRVAGTGHNKQLAGVRVKEPTGWRPEIRTGDDPGPWRLTFYQHRTRQVAVVLPVPGQETCCAASEDACR